MCTGIRDAAALAWKLDLVLRGLAEDSLLDAYCRERKPHAEAMINMSVELTRAWTITDPAIAAARDAGMLASRGEPPPPFPGLVDGILHRSSEGQPLDPAGQLFVQGFAEYKGRTGRFDDVVGQGFVVMALDADPGSELTKAQLAFLELIKARLVRVSSACKPNPEAVAVCGSGPCLGGRTLTGPIARSLRTLSPRGHRYPHAAWLLDAPHPQSDHRNLRLGSVAAGALPKRVYTNRRTLRP